MQFENERQRELILQILENTHIEGSYPVAKETIRELSELEESVRSASVNN